MKIDMAEATVEWLKEWHSAAVEKYRGLYRHDKMDERTAKMRFLYEKLDLYIHTDISYGDNQVTFYVGELYRDAIVKLMGIEIGLPNGFAVLDSIEPDLYYEPYGGDEPSKRLEITFAVPKAGA